MKTQKESVIDAINSIVKSKDYLYVSSLTHKYTGVEYCLAVYDDMNVYSESFSILSPVELYNASSKDVELIGKSDEFKILRLLSDIIRYRKSRNQ